MFACSQQHLTEGAVVFKTRRLGHQALDVVLLCLYLDADSSSFCIALTCYTNNVQRCRSPETLKSCRERTVLAKPEVCNYVKSKSRDELQLVIVLFGAFAVFHAAARAQATRCRC